MTTDTELGSQEVKPVSTRRGTPPPPPHIAALMAEAGRTNDNIRLGILKTQYRAWLTDQGWNEPTHGNPAPGAPE